MQTGAPYGMSKAGLIQLSRNLASEWAESDIRVQPGVRSMLFKNYRRVLSGELTGKTRELWAGIIALGGGAKGAWQYLQQLYISNFNSMSTFAVAEQLGLALSIPEILDVTFPVIKQKSTDQLLLQKCALEMCSISILQKNHSNTSPAPAKYHLKYHPGVPDPQIFLLGLV